MKNVNLLILKNVSGMKSNILIVGRELTIAKKKTIQIENTKKVFIPKKSIMVEIIPSKAFLEFVLIIKKLIKKVINNIEILLILYFRFLFMRYSPNGKLIESQKPA